MRSNSSRDRVEQPAVLEFADSRKAALLEHAHRLDPFGFHVGDDLLHSERLEAVAHTRASRLGRVAAAPAVAAEAVRELPLAEPLVEAKAAIADEVPRFAPPHPARNPVG